MKIHSITSNYTNNNAQFGCATPCASCIKRIVEKKQGQQYVANTLADVLLTIKKAIAAGRATSSQASRVRFSQTV